MQRNTKNGKIVHEEFFLSPEELAAYAMPFNYASEVDQISSMQGMMRFPASVSEFKSDDGAALDPFLMADHHRMSEPTFGPHPHAGFSAVTYMFDDAQTGFNNRDSLGDVSLIAAGDNHWTVAGSGVVHDEVPVVNGKVAHGLQIFVNLAARNKHIAPYSMHFDGQAMARFVQASGARVKVAFGDYDDGTNKAASPQPLPTPVTLLDIALDANQSFKYLIATGTNAFMLVVNGGVAINAEVVNQAEAVSFGRDGGALEITATIKSHIAVFLGQPLNEPVVRHGPFAMTNQADTNRAIADYEAGRMGSLS